MNPATHLAHPRARGTYPRRWHAALALAALFAFALPGVASASEGGFRHNVLMRGQVLEKGFYPEITDGCERVESF